MKIRPMTVVSVEGLSFHILQRIRQKFTECGIVNLPLVGSLHTEPNLHRNGNDIWTLRSNMLGLPLSFHRIEVLLSNSPQRILLTILGNFLSKFGIVGALLPVLLKIIRGTWDFILHSFSGFPLLWVCNRCQKVTDCLAWRTLPAHLDKILFGCAAWTEENLATLVENNDFVEDIVDRLGSLVDRDSMATAGEICRHSQGFGEFKRTCRI